MATLESALGLSDSPPSIDSFNAAAQARAFCTGSGAPLRFVLPDTDTLGYERRAFERGEVVTRHDNWHDAYNAQVWLEFPRAKAALNRRHVEAMRDVLASGETRRGRVRDRLTQFDECGVVVAGMSATLWQQLEQHRWREVFVEARAELLASTRFVIFGHASRDSLRAPFFGVCGKAMWLDVPADKRDDDARIDEALARRLASVYSGERWQPLPLLGIPGLFAANEDPAYYDDVRQFRPRRKSAPV